ncbi:protein kinase domain-containing protein [Eubacterium sp.]
MKYKFDSCPNCFAMLNGKNVCENCGTNINDIKEYSSALPTFTLLNNRYLTGRVLGKGGFGITYLAQDIETGKLCCVKEYMPSEYSRREENSSRLVPIESKYSQIFEHGKRRFIDEAMTLLKLYDNKTVVDIYDYFEQNNTGYFVMEYLNGVSMKKMTSLYNGRLPLQIANKILDVIGVALIDIHSKKMLHRDISPENIFITQSKEIKLIDFGAARDYIKTQNQGMSVLLKAGYAPPEQYSTKGSQGPWTDIYALAATYYTCVSGQKLLDAMFVLNGMKQPELFELNCKIDKHTSDVIAKAMATNFKERYQTVTDMFMDLRNGIPNGNNVIDLEQGSEITIFGKTVFSKNTSSNTNQSNDLRIKPMAEQKVIKPVEPPKADINLQLKPIIEVLGMPYGRRKINVPDGRVIRVGRSNRECELVVDKASTISRVHLLVTYDKAASKFIVTDKSANGTYFSNGIRLKKNVNTIVEPGEVINLVDNSHAIRLAVE